MAASKAQSNKELTKIMTWLQLSCCQSKNGNSFIAFVRIFE